MSKPAQHPEAGHQARQVWLGQGCHDQCRFLTAARKRD